MARRRPPAPIPEPPWTQAPSEVSAWLASTGARSRGRREVRHARVRGFRADLSATAADRAMRRLARGSAPFGTGTRGRRTDSSMIVSGVRVDVHVVRGGSRAAAVRVDFRPPIPSRRAWKILDRLGVDWKRGTFR